MEPFSKKKILNNKANKGWRPTMVMVLGTKVMLKECCIQLANMALLSLLVSVKKNKSTFE